MEDFDHLFNHRTTKVLGPAQLLTIGSASIVLPGDNNIAFCRMVSDLLTYLANGKDTRATPILSLIGLNDVLFLIPSAKEIENIMSPEGQRKLAALLGTSIPKLQDIAARHYTAVTSIEPGLADAHKAVWAQCSKDMLDQMRQLELVQQQHTSKLQMLVWQTEKLQQERAALSSAVQRARRERCMVLEEARKFGTPNTPATAAAAAAAASGHTTFRVKLASKRDMPPGGQPTKRSKPSPLQPSPRPKFTPAQAMAEFGALRAGAAASQQKQPKRRGGVQKYGNLSYVVSVRDVAACKVNSHSPVCQLFSQVLKALGARKSGITAVRFFLRAEDGQMAGPRAGMAAAVMLDVTMLFVTATDDSAKRFYERCHFEPAIMVKSKLLKSLLEEAGSVLGWAYLAQSENFAERMFSLAEDMGWQEGLTAAERGISNTKQMSAPVTPEVDAAFKELQAMVPVCNPDDNGDDGSGDEPISDEDEEVGVGDSEEEADGDSQGSEEEAADSEEEAADSEEEAEAADGDEEAADSEEEADGDSQGSEAEAADGDEEAADSEEEAEAADRDEEAADGDGEEAAAADGDEEADAAVAEGQAPVQQAAIDFGDDDMEVA